MTDRPVSPLLEFDHDREAFISPSALITPRDDVPRPCVLTWFRDAADRAVEETHGRRITQLRWEDGPRPVYEINHEGRQVTLAPMPVGAAPAASMLEELIALGCSSFIACGGAGALRPDLTLGHLVLVTSALRDEGASHHYLPPARTLDSDPVAIDVLRATLTDMGLPFAEGRAWTTDGIYRETPARIAARVEEGCLTVDMEASAVAAVARFRGVPLAQVLYGGDDLTGEVWDERGWQDNHEVRDRLIRVAATAALRLEDATGQGR